MEIKRTNLKRCQEGKLTEIMQEAYRFGVYRGRNAGTNIYSAFVVKFDSVLRQYIDQKFGISGDLFEITAKLRDVPQEILNHLKRGYYSQAPQEKLYRIT